jgi:O-antigen biosynthesis protein
MSNSVIICAHDLNRLEQLRQSIKSVQAQILPAHEIIVVCDHNAELMAVISREFPGVMVIANSEHKGLSGARNTGVSHASGSIVAFLDDDATAEPNWLGSLSSAYDDPDVMAVGGDILPVWPGERPAWFPREFDWVIGCSYLGLPTESGPVRNLIGCNMSMQRECLDAVGGFQHSLGRIGDNASGCEETEVFIRMQTRFADRTILLERRARVHHSIAPSRTHWRYFAARCKAEGRAKATMIRTVGMRKGISTETTYIRRTLPAGFLRGMSDTVRGDPSGLLRSGAIVLGLSFTAAAFIVQRTKMTLWERPVPHPFQPLLIVDADLSEGLPNLAKTDVRTGENYGAAWCLIRSSGQPVKIFEAPFDATHISSDELAELIRSDTAQVPGPPIPTAQSLDAPLPHVTVIVATRDRADSLKRCLNSLLEQSYPAMDIVVVDNAPTSSETADMIAADFSGSAQVTYVRDDTPGLGGAHNSGVAAAKGEIVAFTDDDVIVDKSWVAALAANFAHSKRIGCVTGLILPAELKTRAQYWTERHGGFGKGLCRKVFDLESGSRENPLFPYAAGAFGSGANMAFRRETLALMGGFDAALGAGTLARGGDDLASFVAAIQSGYQIVYEPGAIVWHHHRRSEDGMRRQAYNYGVGLGAYLTKQIVEDPKRLGFFARSFPAAVRHLFSNKSSKMVKLPNDYPRQLVWSERFGILMGVPGYLRSRKKVATSRTRASSRDATAAIKL